MEIEILTTEKSLLSGQADAVFLPGFKGEMEVLNGHTLCIVALKKGVVSVKNGSEKKDIPIDGGYAEITPQKIVILSRS
jgi:F-type H+-transporting ATPase subunit epsilon